MTERHIPIPNLAELRLEIGTKLASSRVAAGLTLEEAASRLGWQPGRLAAIERGERDVYVVDAARLVRLYGIGFGSVAPGDDGTQGR